MVSLVDARKVATIACYNKKPLRENEKMKKNLKKFFLYDIQRSGLKRALAKTLNQQKIPESAGNILKNITKKYSSANDTKSGSDNQFLRFLAKKTVKENLYFILYFTT